MELGGRKSEASYYMMSTNEEGIREKVTLKETENEKDLGVLIDNNLSFKEHVAQMKSKANRMVGLI